MPTPDKSPTRDLQPQAPAWQFPLIVFAVMAPVYIAAFKNVNEQAVEVYHYAAQSAVELAGIWYSRKGLLKLGEAVHGWATRSNHSDKASDDVAEKRKKSLQSLRKGVKKRSGLVG